VLDSDEEKCAKLEKLEAAFHKRIILCLEVCQLWLIFTAVIIMIMLSDGNFRAEQFLFANIITAFLEHSISLASFVVNALSPHIMCACVCV